MSKCHMLPLSHFSNKLLWHLVQCQLRSLPHDFTSSPKATGYREEIFLKNCNSIVLPIGQTRLSGFCFVCVYYGSLTVMYDMTLDIMYHPNNTFYFCSCVKAAILIVLIWHSVSVQTERLGLVPLSGISLIISENSV